MPRPLAVAALALVAACARNNQLADGGDEDLDIGGIRFRVASGTARVEGSVLGLYLTDQPDACQTITHIPVGAATVFQLRVAPQPDGTTSALVVAGGAGPGPGEAVGAISTQTAGVETARRAAVDGSVSWQANEDGTTTIVAIDVGFNGATERLRAAELTVPACR